MSRLPAPPSARPKERVKFWRDPVLRDLEMLHATYVTYEFSRHAHEGFGIAIVEAGVMEFEYRGETCIAPAGSVVVTHPGEMHTGRAMLETGWTYRTMLPAADWLHKAAIDLSEGPEKDADQLPYFSSPVIHDPQLNRQLVKLHRVLETSPSALERESCFVWNMAKLVQGYACDRPTAKAIGTEPHAVRQVHEYLNAHYSENISLNELATMVNLKPLRLLRAFRKQVGLPPHAYLNHVRVRQAKKRILEGHSLIDAALATGFSDQSHLNRHFKKLVGVTPGQYSRGCKRRI